MKMPGRCFSLRSVLRDTVMLLVGTVMGILLSRALFDVPSAARLVIAKRQTDLDASGPASNATTEQRVQEDTEQHSDSASSHPATEVAIGSRTAPRVTTQVVNKQLSNVHVGQKQKNTNPNARPKTLAEELGGNMRQPLFIGVVTSKQLLLTRGKAINSTWGSYLGKGLKFFSSEGTLSHNLPVVSLPGTDDTYPPQKKVYRMLKYMYDHFINKFNWFMRADDDLYVRVAPLVQFLNTLDPSTDLYIGQPGIGKAEDWDRIRLYPNEHYCMGGPGVVLSRSLLIKLAPHLDECLNNVVVSWNEDLEVGRCIMRRLGVQCTWSYEVCTCSLCIHNIYMFILHGCITCYIYTCTCIYTCKCVPLVWQSLQHSPCVPPSHNHTNIIYLVA